MRIYCSDLGFGVMLTPANPLATLDVETLAGSRQATSYSRRTVNDALVPQLLPVGDTETIARTVPVHGDADDFTIVRLDFA